MYNDINWEYMQIIIERKYNVLDILMKLYLVRLCVTYYIWEVLLYVSVVMVELSSIWYVSLYIFAGKLINDSFAFSESI